MSESTDSNENTNSTAVSVNQYNTYGLATQGFVWAALSSVSADWGIGHVKTVNGVAPDSNCEVGVAIISSNDYSGDLNQINSDLSVVMHGDSGHRLLTDVDDGKIRTYVNTVSGDIQTKLDAISSLIPEEVSIDNKLADKSYVSEEISKRSASYRGSWSNWTSVPSDSALYPKDYSGSTIPKLNDYLIVLNASDYGKEGTWRFVYSGSWATSGKNGWLAEYNMSQIAFTEDQWKAINSGINSDKLTSIEAASSNWNTVYNNFSILSGGIYRIAFEVESTSANNHSVFATVSGTSGYWNTAADTVTASSANWDSVYHSVLESSAKWDESEGSTKAYTDMMSTSALTTANKYTDDSVTPVSNTANSVYSSVLGASSDWNDAHTKISEGYAKWNSATTEIEATSSNNRTAYSTLNAASGKWEETKTAVTENSGNWNDAYTKVSEGYNKWNNASTEIESTSSNNRSSYTTLSENSGDWENATSKVAESSGNWDDAHDKITEGYGRWNNAASEIEATSSDNRSVYTTVSENSGNWKETYTKVNTSSGTWDSASDKINSIYDNYLQVSAEVMSTSANNRSSYTTLNETSGRWDNVYATVNTLSSEWSGVYGTTEANSGNWDSTYTIVKSHSAVWDESSGSTKEYTDMMTTSALSTAKKYTDERYADVENYAITVAISTATSALTSANSYTDGRISTIYDEFKRYSDFTSASALSTAETHSDTIATSALTAANKYTDDSVEGILPSANLYSDFVATSALTTAYVYADLKSVGLSSSLSSYSETLAASAINTSNIYTEFLASSALSTAFKYTDAATYGLTSISLSSLSAYSEQLATSAFTAAVSYADSITANINRTVTYTVPFTSTEGISEYSARFGSANNGDVIILKRELYSGSTEHFTFTSYTYYGSEWQAMNGDYDTKNVFFSENLTTTTDIGNVKINPSTGNAVINTKGKNVNTVFNDLFRVEKEPTVTTPFISSIATTGLGMFESGSTTVPILMVTTHSGEYTYGPVSTAELTSIKASINNLNPQDVAVGTAVYFSRVTINDSMSSYNNTLSFSVTGYYSDDSVIPLTNIGTECPNLKIVAGNTGVAYSSDRLQSYRKAFFGTLTTNINAVEITSATVRSLAGSTQSTPSPSSTIKVDYPIGAKSMIIAIPAFCGTVESVVDDNGIGVNIISVFDTNSVNVNGANSSTSIPYNVYVKNAATANDIATKYTIKIKES